MSDIFSHDLVFNDLTFDYDAIFGPSQSNRNEQVNDQTYGTQQQNRIMNDDDDFLGILNSDVNYVNHYVKRPSYSASNEQMLDANNRFFDSNDSNDHTVSVSQEQPFESYVNSSLPNLPAISLSNQEHLKSIEKVLGLKKDSRGRKPLSNSLARPKGPTQTDIMIKKALENMNDDPNVQLSRFGNKIVKKNSVEYYEKRIKNQDAVRRCREKDAQIIKERQDKIDFYEQDNKNQQNILNELIKEFNGLKLQLTDKMPDELLEIVNRIDTNMHISN